jgi:hypothetical protein
VSVEGYSRRPGEQPTYRPLRATVTVPDSGIVDYTFAPTTHTRLRATVACGVTDSIVVQVAPAMTLTVRRLGRLAYRLSGRLVPAAATNGAVVTVTYRAADGRQVRKAVSRATSGTWSVDVRFTRPGRVTVRASLASTSWLLSGRTADQAVTVR